MLRPSAFKMPLYFHAVMFAGECLRTKMVSSVHNSNSCMRHGYPVQLVMKALKPCTQAAETGSIQTVLQTCMIEHIRKVMFKVICVPKEGMLCRGNDCVVQEAIRMCCPVRLKNGRGHWKDWTSSTW